MRLSDAKNEYQYAIATKSPETQRWYLQKLQRFIDWCAQQGADDLEALQQNHIRKFLAVLSEEPSPRTGQPISSYTAHGYGEVIKVFLNWCHQEDLCSDRLARRMELPRVDKKVIETFSPEQIKRLFVAAKAQHEPILAARDRAILALMFDTGIRAGEVCNLTVDCVFLSPQEAFIKVYGKGKKWREVGLGNESRIALNRYINRYRHATPNENHVFISRYEGKPLTRDALIRTFYRLGEASRTKGVRCSPHTARHTFAVTYLQAGGDLYKLSRLLGHTSVSTTENYLRAFKARDARKDGPSVLDLTIGQQSG